MAEPEADWLAARAHLSEIARDAATLALALPDGDLPARAAALAGLMCGRHGYQGDTETYDDLYNANIIRVIARRRGLPVALGILWLHAAAAAGWDAHGVNFPGHFLVALKSRGRQLALDVFAGGAVLDTAELRTLLKRALGAKAELGPDMLQPMPARDVLLRLQVNVKTRLLQLGQLRAGLACTEDMLRIAPEAAPLLWREAAILHQRLDHFSAALRCYERFLQLVPHGDAATRARAAVHELRGRLN